jgi:hypothetical protein
MGVDTAETFGEGDIFVADQQKSNAWKKQLTGEKEIWTVKSGSHG